MSNLNYSQGGAYGAQGKPNEKQRTFILENVSEQLGGIMSHNSSLLIEEVNNVPVQKVLDSLPGSLQDSEESIAAMKNTSRYGVDQSPSLVINSPDRAPTNKRFVPDPKRVA